MWKSYFLFVFIIIAGCGPDRHIELISDSEKQILLEFQQLNSSANISIGSPEEPGEHLALCLTFKNAKSEEVLVNQPVHFYHTDTEGNYKPAIAADESTARLNKSARTDDSGRIFLKTILPGDYGSSRDNRHIHTTVAEAHPEAYDIHFQQYTSWMGRRFSKGSDQHFLADLKKDANGNLVAFLTILVKKPKYFVN